MNPQDDSNKTTTLEGTEELLAATLILWTSQRIRHHIRLLRLEPSSETYDAIADAVSSTCCMFVVREREAKGVDTGAILGLGDGLVIGVLDRFFGVVPGAHSSPTPPQKPTHLRMIH